MGAARSALADLLGALAHAVEPAPVGIAGSSEPGDSGSGPDEAGSQVRVRPVSLTRVGRSQRDGAVLDLELVAAVGPEGPEALELAEAMLTALERAPRLSVEPAGPGDPPLAFRVRLPVAVRLEQPVRWRVEEPMRLDVQVARSLAGVLLDAGGDGLPEARVAARPGGGAATTDKQGRFRVLVAQGDRQSFDVEVRGTTRTIDAATHTAPVVLRWE